MIKTARQLKDLIRNLSREKSADAQILMRNYMMERFLERISLSEYRDKFQHFLAETVKGMLLVFVVAVRCHCLTSLLAGRQVISSPFAHYSSTGGFFWLARLGKLQKNISIAHSLCSFRFVRVDRPDRNERAVSGTGESIEKRPDSMKLFERKKHGIQLYCDNFRTGCQTGPVRWPGFF